MKEAIKIILADVEVLIRKGISFLLSKEDNIEVIFEASDGVELTEFLKGDNPKPDFVIIDLKMSLLNGIEDTKIIRKDFSDIKIPMFL